MDHLPLSDIPMLVSTINFLLRDEIFDNQPRLCLSGTTQLREMKADKNTVEQAYALKGRS